MSDIANPLVASRTIPMSFSPVPTALRFARQVFDVLWSGEAGDVDAVIDAQGLKQMNDSGALEKIIEEVIAANPANVEQYKAGKDKAFNALVGQVMKASKGKANPQQVNDILKAKLG